jgi:hypothetical protein
MFNFTTSVEDLVNNAALKEMLEFQVTLTKAIELRKAKDKSLIRQQIKELASSAGFELSDFLTEGKEKKIRKRPSTKIQNPDNSNQYWIRIGPKPQWLKDLEAKGVNIADYEVPLDS